MRQNKLYIFIFTAIVLTSSGTFAASDAMIDVFPGAFLASFRADAFSVTGPTGKETMSLVSTMPTIAAGISVEQPEGYLNLKGGIGTLLNSRFDSFTLFGSAGFSFQVKPSVMLGPHIGISQYSAPSWWGDGEITFSDSTGFNGGIDLIMGDKVSYLFSLDYYSLKFDIESSSSGYEPSDTSLDMSGLAVQFGIHAQF